MDNAKLIQIVTDVNDKIKLINDKYNEYLGAIDDKLAEIDSIIQNGAGNTQKRVRDKLQQVQRDIETYVGKANKWLGDQADKVDEWAAGQIKKAEDSAKRVMVMKLLKSKEYASQQAGGANVEITDEQIEKMMGSVSVPSIPVPKCPRLEIPVPDLTTMIPIPDVTSMIPSTAAIGSSVTNNARNINSL